MVLKEPIISCVKKIHKAAWFDPPAHDIQYLDNHGVAVIPTATGLRYPSWAHRCFRPAASAAALMPAPGPSFPATHAARLGARVHPAHPVPAPFQEREDEPGVGGQHAREDSPRGGRDVVNESHNISHNKDNSNNKKEVGPNECYCEYNSRYYYVRTYYHHPMSATHLRTVLIMVQEEEGARGGRLLPRSPSASTTRNMGEQLKARPPVYYYYYYILLLRTATT